MPGLNSIYNEYGKNKNTLLIFETNFPDSKSSFASWCNSKGVQYGAIASNEGGSQFNIKLKNNNAGNPKYLIHPDSTFEKVGSVQSALNAANVSKDPIDDEDTEKPEVSITTDLDGKTFTGGSKLTLSWTATDNEKVTAIRVEYKDGSWKEIGSFDGDKTTVEWTLPEKEVVGCKIKVSAFDAANNSAFDESGTFDITVDIDTTNPSPNLLSFTNVYPTCDEYGTEIDTSDGFKSSKGVQADFTVVSSDSVKDEWAWGSIISELPEEDESSLEGVTYVRVTYSANSDIRLILQQPPLDATGESFSTVLQKSTTNKMVTLKIDENTFEKPKWSTNTESLDLSKVKSLSFETIADYSGGGYSIGVKELILYNYNGSTPSLNTTSKAIDAVKLQSTKGALSLTVPSKQLGSISLFTATGREVFRAKKQLFSTGTHAILLPTSVAQGVYLAKYTSVNTELVSKIIIKK